MLSLTKLVQTTKAILNPRLAASFQSQSANYAKTAEEKLGLPPRPKKPLTPYFRYMIDQRPLVAKANPKLSITEAVSICAKQWTSCDEATKKKFLVEYMKEKEEFVKKRAEYESTLTAEEKSAIQSVKGDVVRSKEKRAYKKKLREMDKPKKPKSGFIRFLVESFENYRKGEEDYRSYHKKLVQQWKELAEAKRAEYNAAAKAELVTYKQDLAKWELKMIRLGNVELVRQEALIEPTTKSVRKHVGRPRNN